MARGGRPHGWERYYQILVDEEITATPGLPLSGPPGLTMHLLDELGTPVTAGRHRRGRRAAARPGGRPRRLRPADRSGADIGAPARLAPGGLPAASFKNWARSYRTSHLAHDCCH